jgi:hypothetical protein
MGLGAVTVLVLPAVLDTGLVALYFNAPLDRPWSSGTALALAAALVLFAGLIGWQTWAVVRSPYPRLRAVAVIAFSFPGLILLFATGYELMSLGDPGAFSEPLDRVGALYFAMTVFSTVGFGDIVARTQPARIVVIVQMLANLIYLGVLVRALVEAARIGVDRNTKRRPDR